MLEALLDGARGLLLPHGGPLLRRELLRPQPLLLGRGVQLRLRGLRRRRGFRVLLQRLPATPSRRS